MSPCPSLPNHPAPKVSSSPLLPIKAVWSGPQLTFFTRTSVLICLGKLIALRIMLEPWPNLPHSALPHVYTSPPGVMPAEWSSPAATELAFAKAATKVGSLVSVVVPRPSWPRWLRPQENSSRLVEIIKQCSIPKATDNTLIFTLEMGSTADSNVGFHRSSSWAEAFWPYSPWPQNQHEPSFSIAAECIPPHAISCSCAFSPTKPRCSSFLDSLFCHPRSGFPAM